MTPSQLRAIRSDLGLSTEGLARLLRVKSGRTIRYWEAGEREIPGPVVVLLTGLLESEDVRSYFLESK